MSQYTVLSEHARYRIIVGVDAPLSTLFVQVEEPTWQGRRIKANAEIGDISAPVDF